MFGTRIHRTWRRIRQNLYQDSEHSGRRKCSFLKPDKGYRTDWESKIKQCDDWLPNRRKRICMYTFVFTNGIKSFHHHILLLFNGLLCRKMVRHAQVVVDGEYAIHFSLPEPDGHGMSLEHVGLVRGQTTWASFTSFYLHKLLDTNWL